MINRIGNVYFDTNMNDGRNGMMHIGDSEKFVIREWLNETVSQVRAELSWRKNVNDTENAKKKLDFLGRVASGLTQAYYSFNISVMEPSVKRVSSKKTEILFQAELPIYSGQHCMNWEALFATAVPDGRSHLANLFELDLLFAWEIAVGALTLEQVVVDSSDVGGYVYKNFRGEKFTGQIKCGKFFDGQGNTKKIVKLGNEFVVTGGAHWNNGKNSPIAGYIPWDKEKGTLSSYTGVLVIKD